MSLVMMKKDCSLSPDHPLHTTCKYLLDPFDLVNSTINTCIILVNVNISEITMFGKTQRECSGNVTFIQFTETSVIE